MPPGEDDLLSQLEPDIQRLAQRWALDDPDAWEDLAQEARIGIIQELRENPDSPRSHLFARAKRAILDYRRRGYLVDGKLNKNHRRRFVWCLVSLDADPDQSARGGLGDGGSLYFKPWQENPVEALAVARITCGELRATLSSWKTSTFPSSYRATWLKNPSPSLVCRISGIVSYWRLSGPRRGRHSH